MNEEIKKAWHEVLRALMRGDIADADQIAWRLEHVKCCGKKVRQ